MGLLQLAPEILVEIFLYLDVSDACAIQSTNRFLNSVYKRSLELQYTLACEVAHVLDNPNCHLPVKDRLQMLRDREAGWRSLSPTSTTTMSPSPHFLRCPIVPAIERDHFLFYDSLAIHSHSMRESESPSRSLLEIDGLSHISCCIEEHDLIACLCCIHLSDDTDEVQIKLIQHSTGAAHPLAANPTITLGPSSETRMYDSMQIFGDNLVLRICLEDEDRLYIYDWMTGTAKCEPYIFSRSTGFAVLDEDLILVSDLTTWSLLVYYIPPSSTGGAVRLICQLCLPPFTDPSESELITAIECEAGQNPTKNGKFPKYVPSSVPFIDDPKMALILVTFQLWALAEASFISLVVHRHSIINALPSSNYRSVISAPILVDWKTWGPSVTDWSSTSLFVSCEARDQVYGQRLILPVSQTDAKYGQCAALVKDFNKYYAPRSEKEKGCETCFDGNMFEFGSVKNTLPCRTHYLPNQFKSFRYSITDSLIVGISEIKDDRADLNKYSLKLMQFGH